jgi:hypothetical protein
MMKNKWVGGFSHLLWYVVSTFILLAGVEGVTHKLQSD